jgi:hypothetical protein
MATPPTPRNADLANAQRAHKFAIRAEAQQIRDYLAKNGHNADSVIAWLTANVSDLVEREAQITRFKSGFKTLWLEEIMSA